MLKLEKLYEFFIGILVSLWAFYVPIYPLIAIVGGFIMADTIMGVTKSIILKRPVKSKKMQRLVFKLFFYTSAVLLVYGLDNLLLSDIFGLDSSKFIPTKIATSTLIFIEGVSMNEHLEELNGGRGIPHYWKKMIEFIKGIKGDINDVNNPDKK